MLLESVKHHAYVEGKKRIFPYFNCNFILAAACSMAVWQYLNSGAGTVAKIFQNGELIREVDLTHVDSPILLPSRQLTEALIRFRWNRER